MIILSIILLLKWSFKAAKIKQIIDLFFSIFVFAALKLQTNLLNEYESN